MSASGVNPPPPHSAELVLLSMCSTTLRGSVPRLLMQGGSHVARRESFVKSSLGSLKWGEVIYGWIVNRLFPFPTLGVRIARGIYLVFKGCAGVVNAFQLF